MLKYIKSSLKNFETNFYHKFLFILMLVILMTTFFVGIIIYNNSYENALYKYNDFDEKTFVFQPSYNIDDPYVFSGQKDLNFTRIENITYSQFTIVQEYVHFDNQNLDVLIKGTSANFINNADIVDFDYMNNNILNIKKNKLLSGRVWNNEEFQNKSKVVLIYESTAIRLFGKKDVLGKLLNINDKSFTIIGILEDSNDIKAYNKNFKGGQLKIVLYTPITIFDKPFIRYSIIRSDDFYALLKIINENIDAKASLSSRNDSLKNAIFIKTRELQSFFYALIIIFILIIAGIFLLTKNYLNQMLLECAIRRSLGSSKRQIYFLLLPQLSFMFAIAFFIAILFSIFISYIHFFAIYTNVFPFIGIISIKFILLFGGIFMGVILSSGSILSQKIINFNIIDGLKGNEKWYL